MPRTPPAARLILQLLCLALVAVCFTLPACAPQDPRPKVRAELRSWVVAARGRHLFLEIFTGKGTRPVRVEFGSTAQRPDYQPPRGQAAAGRVSRMTPGAILQPIMGVPDNRLEAEYWLTPSQVESLTRDRVFTARYELVGKNSNAAMARALRDAGLTLPARVARGAGLLGEFPGIDLDVGSDIARSRWPDFGVFIRPAPVTANTPPGK